VHELTHFDPPTCSVFRLLILSEGLCQEATSFLRKHPCGRRHFESCKNAVSDAACGTYLRSQAQHSRSTGIPLPTACTALMHADWAGRASYIPVADVDNCAVCHMLTPQHQQADMLYVLRRRWSQWSKCLLVHATC